MLPPDAFTQLKVSAVNDEGCASKCFEQELHVSQAAGRQTRVTSQLQQNWQTCKIEQYSPKKTLKVFLEKDSCN